MFSRAVGFWIVVFLLGELQAQNNIALGRPVSASGPTWSGQIPEHLTDGNPANQSHPLASSGTIGFYYEIDLGSTRNLGSVVLVNRNNCCPERLSNYRVEVRSDQGGTAGPVQWSAEIRTDGSHSGRGGRDLVPASLDPGNLMRGRYLRVVNLSNAAYNPQIAEVEVFEAPLPVIETFSLDHGNITAGGDPFLPANARLSWSVSNADTVAIDQGVGMVGLNGQQSVSPQSTTIYVLTATNGAGSSSASVTLGVDEAVIPPVLTEFMADNASTLDDQFEESSDWIEIFNPNSFQLSLTGYHLTDRPENPTLWTFPEGAHVPANDRLIVFASGRNLLGADEPLHTNFSLGREGEYLALVDRDGFTTLTAFDFPEQKQDVSYGLEPDGVTRGFFLPPTPGWANGTSFAGFVEDTKFDIRRGFFESPQTVAISTATPGATIRYTTDGSEPSESRGTIYSSPLSVSATTVLRAMAYKDGLAPTNVDTNTYLFVDDVITSPELGAPVSPLLRDSLTDVPSLSIVTEDNINGTSEVAASFELIHPDGSPGFQENCGVKHFGGAFTNFEKKNFRLYFRSRYGVSNLEFPLFEGFDRGITATDKFDQLNIRSGSHDMVSRGFYMSNRFTDDTMLDMGNINPHGRFMHLYLNGRYWGVFHLRERWHADLLTEYLGGPKPGYEAINGNWNVGGWADEIAPPYDGDGSAWERIKRLGRTSSPDNFEDLNPYLDIQNYLDYMILFMFGDSEDEYRTVGPNDVGSGFKWFLNDADGFLRRAGNRTGFANNTPGVFGRSNGDGPGSLLSLLFKAGNPEFRILLADRIHKHYFNDGALTPPKTTARLAERCDEMDSPFHAEALRWGYRSHSSWTGAKNDALNNILPPRTASAVTQFRSAGFYPSVVAPVFSQHGGVVPPGFNLTLSEGSGTMYYTTDGTDPRLVGGAVNPNARVFESGEVIETVIETGSVWKFLDDGSDQGTNWRTIDFDDSAWESGPAILGYGEAAVVTPVSFGDDPAQKFPTTYFRKVVSISNVDKITGATIQLKRDDGAVVYLNGIEVGRSSMPEGQVDYLTFANNASDDGRDFHDIVVSNHLFAEGKNVIAIEVHQGSARSSDVQFDLELKIAKPVEGSDPLTLTENEVIRARSFDRGSWSALNEAFFQVSNAPPVGPGEVVPSEIHYHPRGPDDAEFLELHNPSGHAVNLRGCFFGDGIEFAFPDNRDVVLASGERLILVDSQYDVDRAYGIGLPISGVYRGKLNNGGETIVLMAANGVTELFRVTYDGADPWPEAADGDGRSLVLKNPSLVDSAASWRPSVNDGGTPGGTDSMLFVGEPDDDLDGDGYSAFAEYAMGTDDSEPTDTLDVIHFVVDGGGQWQFSFPEALGADDAIASLELASDLESWRSSSPGEAVLIRSVTRGNQVWRTYRSTAPTGRDPLFIRVRFESSIR